MFHQVSERCVGHQDILQFPNKVQYNILYTLVLVTAQVVKMALA